MTRETEAEARLLARIADAVVDVVKSASREDFGRVVGMGADGTDTKLVDQLAEDEVRRILDETDDPVVNIVSEECGFIDRGGELRLVVDPIDGTTNAARGLPMYCIGVALGKSRLSDVHHALVRNIPTGDTYTAVKGQGAFKNGKPIRVRPAPEYDAIVSTDLGTHEVPGGLRRAIKTFVVRSLGSATLEMCFVAEGSLDLYYMAAEKLRVTDVAPSALIVREAGGLVLDARGNDLDMDLTLEPRTSCVTAADAKGIALSEAFR